MFDESGRIDVLGTCRKALLLHPELSLMDNVYQRSASFLSLAQCNARNTDQLYVFNRLSAVFSVHGNLLPSRTVTAECMHPRGVRFLMINRPWRILPGHYMDPTDRNRVNSTA